MANPKTNTVRRSINEQPEMRTTLSLILSVMLSLVFIVFAIKPTMVTIASLKKQLKDEQQILTLLQQKVQALQMAEQAYYQNQSWFPSLEKAMPENTEISRFNLQLLYLANKHGVDLQSLSFQGFDLINNLPVDEKKPAQYIEIGFNLSLQAPWQQTKEFIKSLEELERVVIMPSANHSINRKKEGQDTINTTLQGKIYYFPKKGYQ